MNREIRLRLLARLLNRVVSGEMDQGQVDAFLNALVTAIGSRLDPFFGGERNRLLADLQLAKAQSQEAAAELDREILIVAP